MLNITELLTKIINWGNSEENILAIGLVGSHARNAATDDSDIDLMIICKNPEKYISDEIWIHKFGEVKEIKNEIWSQLKTKRVFYENDLEVEFNFDKKSWADPKDSGTKRIVTDGMKILVDKEQILENLRNSFK
jgi:predicted nucleotidyltransferase